MIQPKKELNCHTSCGTSWTFAGPVLVFRVGQIDPFVCRPVLRPGPACIMLCCSCNTWLHVAKHDKLTLETLGAEDLVYILRTEYTYILAGLYTPQGQLQWSTAVLLQQ